MNTEAQWASGKKFGTKPSQEEVDRHELTHLPFRSWCQHCVFGRAKNDPHFASKGPESEGVSDISTVSLDYMYLDEKGNVREEIVEGKGNPIIVVHDSTSKRIFSAALLQKGDNDYAVKKVVNWIHSLGYKRIILKGDQEPALVTLRERIKTLFKGEIVPESSPVGESSSNGAIENSVQQVQGMFKLGLLGVVPKLSMRIRLMILILHYLG